MLDLASWILDLKCWMLHLVSWTLSLGSWILDLGYAVSLILYVGSWMLANGYWVGGAAAQKSVAMKRRQPKTMQAECYTKCRGGVRQYCPTVEVAYREKMVVRARVWAMSWNIMNLIIFGHGF